MFGNTKSFNTCANAVLTKPHDRFASRLLPCRWYIVWNRPRNPLFRCAKSLLLLWKPHSWF